jgi:hypothetical protein
MRQKISIPLVLLVALLLAGFTCNHQAAQVSLGVAASVNNLQSAEIRLHDIGKITDDEHRLLMEGFKTLAQTNIDVRRCIATTNTPTCVDAGINSINDFVDSKANGIKDPDSRTQMKLLAQAVITSLVALKSAL